MSQTVPMLPTTAYFPTAPAAPSVPVAPAPPAPPMYGADQFRTYGSPTLVAPTAPAAPAAPTYSATGYTPAPAPVAVQTTAAAPTTVSALSGTTNGPLVQTGVAGILSTAARVIPAGTAAAVGAAQAIARNSNGTMIKGVAQIVESAGEPLLKLSWALVGNAFEFAGNVLTLRFGDAARSIGKIFSEGAFSLGAMGKKLAQPVTLTAATSGGAKLGLGQAIGAGLSGGMRALKTSFVWAIPAAAINAFIDYKYRDQNDTKRIGTNFAADVIGYTATGMAGAAVGAMVGSMTMPIVGTLVGAAVGIGLGFMHDKITRPMLSDMLHDAL